MFINCLDLLSLCSSDILSICEQFSHLYVQAATQNFFITHFNLSINQFEVGQSDIKSGSHSVSHFMFSHCQSVSYFIFSICLSVSQSVILCSVSVCQSVILCSVSLSQSVSQLLNQTERHRKKLSDQQINQIRQTKRHTDKKMVFCPSVSHLVLKKRQASLTKHH